MCRLLPGTASLSILGRLVASDADDGGIATYFFFKLQVAAMQKFLQTLAMNTISCFMRRTVSGPFTMNKVLHMLSKLYSKLVRMLRSGFPFYTQLYSNRKSQNICLHLLKSFSYRFKLRRCNSKLWSIPVKECFRNTEFNFYYKDGSLLFFLNLPVYCID